MAEGHNFCYLYYKILSKGVLPVNNLILEILRLDFRLLLFGRAFSPTSSWLVTRALGCLYFLCLQTFSSGLLSSNWRFIMCCSVRGEEGQRRRKMEEKQEETEKRQPREEPRRMEIKYG